MKECEHRIEEDGKFLCGASQGLGIGIEECDNCIEND